MWSQFNLIVYLAVASVDVADNSKYLWHECSMYSRLFRADDLSSVSFPMEDKIELIQEYVH